MSENIRTRPQFGEDEIQSVIRDIRRTLAFRLDQKGSGIFVSRHEIYGLLAEEMDELLSALRDNDRIGFREELIDVAVGCIAGLCSLKTHKMDW